MTQVGRESSTRLDETLELLPRGIEPPRDLWPDIEARLEPRPAAPRRHWPWLAAAGVLLAVGSSLLTATLMRHEEPAVVQTAPQAAPAVARAAFGPGQALDPSYDAIRDQLAASLAQRIERLPPAARIKLEANLAELRRAKAEINAALELRPGDPLLEELLLNSYQDELAVLASVTQLTGPNGAGAMTDDTTTRMPL